MALIEIADKFHGDGKPYRRAINPESIAFIGIRQAIQGHDQAGVTHVISLRVNACDLSFEFESESAAIGVYNSLVTGYAANYLAARSAALASNE